jgi:hypothetical protein
MKDLQDLTEEHAVEIAEVATGRHGRMYFYGWDYKGSVDARILIWDEIHDYEFVIYPYKREFDYTDLETDHSMRFNVINMVDKIKELGYENSKSR